MDERNLPESSLPPSSDQETRQILVSQTQHVTTTQDMACDSMTSDITSQAAQDVVCDSITEDIASDHTNQDVVCDSITNDITSSHTSQDIVCDNITEDIATSHATQTIVSSNSTQDIVCNNMIQDVIMERPKVVLVTVPEGIGASGEGDVEIIVTTHHLTPDSEEPMFELTSPDTQYQPLEVTSSTSMDFNSASYTYAATLTSQAEANNTDSITEQFQPVNSSSDAIYTSALSSGIIPCTQADGTQVVYTSSVTAGEMMSAFQATVNNAPTQSMIQLSRFPSEFTQTVTVSPDVGSVQIDSMSDGTESSHPGQQAVVGGSAPDVNLMTPEARAMYEKLETMKSLELVEAQWKSSIAETESTTQDCVILPVTEEDGQEAGSGVFCYKVVDINAESEHEDQLQVSSTGDAAGKGGSSTAAGKESSPVKSVKGDNHSAQAAAGKGGNDRLTCVEGSSSEANVAGGDFKIEPVESIVIKEENVFNCTVCLQVFGDIDKLTKHVSSHSEGLRFKCSECEVTYPSAALLRNHKKTHSEPSTFECVVCSKTFSSTSSLQTHILSHTGAHDCTACKETFETSNLLRYHKCRQKSTRSCDICEKQFVSLRWMEKHKEEHRLNNDGVKGKGKKGRKGTNKVGRKSLKTTSAQTKVKKQGAGSQPVTRGLKMKSAKKSKTVLPKSFSCMICNEKYNSKDLLKQHAKSHLGQRILRCDKCGKVFHDSIKLKMHKLIHSGQSFTCNFCGKSFTYANTLALHKKGHLKEKGFKCKTCGKRFATGQLLKTHKATHTSSKVFVCDICEKAFTSQYYLKAHKRLHTGEKHYGCLQCGKSFMFSNSLRRHVIKEHTAKSPKKQEFVLKSTPDKQEFVLKSTPAEEDSQDAEDSEVALVCLKEETENGDDVIPEVKIKYEKGLYSGTKDVDGMFGCRWCDKKFQSGPALNTHMKEHVAFPYTCNLCNKTFSRNIYLQKHLQRHNDVRMYQCDHCEKTFRSQGYLEQHKQIHTGEKSYQCQLCNQEFIFANSLRRHLRTHNDIGPNMQGLVRKKKKEKTYKPVSEFSSENISHISCSLCGYTFQTVPELNEHLKTHTGESPVYECNVCQKEFISHRDLLRHKQSHIEDKPITCKICNKSFRGTYYLKAHMNLHNGHKPYKCPECDMAFTYASTRRRHMRTHIPEENMNFMCSVCGKKFYEQSECDRHMVAHSNEKPFMCDVCGKTFSTKPLLRSHINRHNGERQYKCAMCTKTFLYRYRLKKHIKTHAGEKSFKCNMCGKGFLTQSYLSTHLRFHTGEKPYKCEICGEEFSFSNTFRRHKRIHDGLTLNCGVCGKMCLELFDLKRHMQSHSDQKTVMCDVCGKTFSHQGSCKRHMRKSHPKVPMTVPVPENTTVSIQVL